MMSKTTNLSSALKKFLGRLESNGLDSVLIYTVRTKFLPRISHLEVQKAILLVALENISKKDFEVSEYTKFVYTTAIKAIRDANALEWTITREG